MSFVDVEEHESYSLYAAGWSKGSLALANLSSTEAVDELIEHHILAVDDGCEWALGFVEALRYGEPKSTATTPF